MKKQRHSPFKFLDAYTAADKNIFFGRDKEIEALYNMVFKTPLVLVYGLSGTGKTSLIQCGLSKRFDGPDWLPFYIRKGDDINQSLRLSLEVALEGKKVTDLKVAVEDLFYSYFRPVYLIFDQFEELFILGEPAEQEQFMKDIQALIAAELPCKVLFVMREEYLGQLYDVEKEIPTIFDYKLRVERMDNKRVKEVMEQSFEKFHISVGPSEEDLYQKMIDNISGGKSGIPLTYLQVYMDMLYVEEYERTYPNGVDNPMPALEFTEQEIDEFGKIDDVLERYLKEQVSEIQVALITEFPDCDEQTVRNILDVFVSQDGTKRPIGFTQEQKSYFIDQNISEQLELPIDVLSLCIEKLEHARLLRLGDDTIELGHDTLAILIDQQRTGQQRQLNDIKKRFLSDYKTYQQTEEFLSEKRINAYEDFLPFLMLSKEQKLFVEKSRQYNLDLVEAEKERQRRELQLAKDKLAVEEKAKKKQRTLSIFLGICFLAAFGGGILAFNQMKIAEEAKALADLEKDRAKRAEEEAKIEKEKTQEAYRVLDSTYYASTITSFDKIIIEANNQIGNKKFEAANSSLIAGIDLVKAFNKEHINKNAYQNLDTISYTPASTLLKNIEQSPQYVLNLEEASRLKKANKFLEALPFYIKALNTGIEKQTTIQEILDLRENGIIYYNKTAEKHLNNDTKVAIEIAQKVKNKGIELNRIIEELGFANSNNPSPNHQIN